MPQLLAAFVGGNWWVQQQAELPALWVLVCVFIGACGLTWLCRHRARLRMAVIAIAAVCAGGAWATYRAEMRLADQLDVRWEGQDVVVRGVVAALPNAFERGQRFAFDVLESEPPGVVPMRIMLTRYDRRGDFAKDNAKDTAEGATTPPMIPADHWQLRVRLRRPVGNANPHQFDYEYWLLEQGIRATGYVREGPGNVQLPSSTTRFGWSVERWRESVRTHLLIAMPDGARFRGVLVALVVGDQRGIEAADWTMFNRTGVGHLISISGLHITMIGSFFGLVVALLWRMSFGVGRWLRKPLPLSWPARSAGIVAGMLAAAAYCLLAGMQIPAQRTVLMLAVVGLSFLAGRGSARAHVLAWAAALVVLVDPWAVCSAGFWLSFGAVALIFLVVAGHRAPLWGARVPSWLTPFITAARLQWALTIGLVPLTLLLFQQISVVSPLANAIAIPLVSFVVTPLALLAAVTPTEVAAPLLVVAHFALSTLVIGLTWLSDLSWAVWQAAAPPWWAVLSGAVGVALWLVPGGVSSWPLRVHACVLLLPVCLARAPRPADGEWWMTALDVGQGTAVLIETARHRLLYDAGPSYGASSAGERVVLPFLRGLGAERLDGLIISHEDQDHAGGAAAVLTSVPVTSMLAALPADHPLWQTAAERQVKAAPCGVGQAWEWDGVRFEMLHPEGGQAQNSALASNARSCVVRVSNGRHAALLTGDIGVAEELQLLARHAPAQVQADILLVPHHGSGTSSSERFIQNVAPQVAIFQMGYRNRYGHPRADIWARYAAQNVLRLRSDERGAVAVQTAGPLLNLFAWREQRPRYWYTKICANDAPDACLR